MHMQRPSKGAEGGGGGTHVPSLNFKSGRFAY